MRRPRTEAEETLDAIRSGQVDALVVAGPAGERTLAIEGTTHPYFVLLNAMSDGAALLERTGAILFANQKLSDVAGVPADDLIGRKFERIFSRHDRAELSELIRDASRGAVETECDIRAPSGWTTPAAVTISPLLLDGGSRKSKRERVVLMAILIDLTFQRSTEAARTRLLERLISAEDDERRRIARELHDETGQSLAALLVGLRVVAELATIPEVRAEALRLRDVAAGTVIDVGRLARGLHPGVLDDKGLAAAATRYAGDYTKAHGTRVDFVAGRLDTPRLAPLIAATMYRILQEALTNVARHAKATRVVVEMTRDAVGIGILVRDNGVGFDLSRVRKASGLGLRGMRERVTLLGGSIQFQSTRKRGTSLRATIPVARAKPRERSARVAK